MCLSDPSKGFGGLGLAGWIEPAWCRDQDTSLALEGPQHVSLGQSAAAKRRPGLIG